MKFKDAYYIALLECEYLRHADEVMMNAFRQKVQSPCYRFAIDGDVYYIGFDGVDLHKGKYSKARSRKLIEQGDVLIIRS